MTRKYEDFPSLLGEVCHAAEIHPDEKVIEALTEERVKEQRRPFLHIDPEIVEMIRALKDGGSRELAGAKAAGLTPIWATWFLERWPDADARLEKADPFRAACDRCRRPEEVVRYVRSRRGYEGAK